MKSFHCDALRRLVLPIVLVIVSFYIETAGGVLGNIVARVMALEGAPLYLGTVTVSVRSEMYTASASWHMYFSFRLFMIAWAVQLRTMCVAYTAGGADAYRVLCVHGGTKAPPYNPPDKVGLHREATSSTKWISSAKRISFYRPTINRQSSTEFSVPLLGRQNAR